MRALMALVWFNLRARWREGRDRRVLIGDRLLEWIGLQWGARRRLE